MNCPDGIAYLYDVEKLEVLNEKLDETILDIRSVLFPKALSPCTPGPFFSKNAWGGIKVPYPAFIRVIQLSQQDWTSTVGRKWQEARGIQQPLIDKILLQRDNWCRETLIHESLHRFSIFSKYFGLRKYLSVFEDGLTEFLTGYILFKKYPSCYAKWLTKTAKECSMTYGRSVRRFYAFGHFVDIHVLIDFYFWQPNRNWENSWAQFLGSIREIGYPDFRDIFNCAWIDATEAFFEECRRAFGNRFLTLSSSKIDYNSLP